MTNFRLTVENLRNLIAGGRTDLIIELMKHDDWQKELDQGPINILQWLVYYGDVTGMRAVLNNGASLSSINLDDELGNASFFGHWKMVDFLISQGANVNHSVDKTGERPLHNAFTKAGRPYYRYVVQVLVENGADVNATTVPGIETGAFMRDVRTCGETPLHRAAAYADPDTIQYLINNGADIRATDVNGDTPLSWASRHLRPGIILKQLAHDAHRISDTHVQRHTSDHGNGWGNAMEWNLIGEYLPESKGSTY